MNSGHRKAAAADTLTPSEIELLKLLANSHSTKQAADFLGIAEHTVSNRREELMRKLNAHDVAALVRIAVKMRMVVC